MIQYGLHPAFKKIQIDLCWKQARSLGFILTISSGAAKTSLV